MALAAPKKSAAGYFLAATEPVTSPELTWQGGEWIPSVTWDSWATNLRSRLLDTLLAHPAWFSRTPRREVLDPLFGPWSGRNMQGQIKFFCKTPSVPGAEGSTGTATWQFGGLLMNAQEISPIFTVGTYTEAPQEDQISLFGDGETVEGSESDEDETREIHLEEIEDASPAQGPAQTTRLRGREWEARKFLAKERVREARLKAQIADRMARKEESRYYANFGDLEDGESHFSDYDLTDNSASEDEDDGSENASTL
jgi:hypothetical protein